jgi:predicted alpha/beta hydrolase family esterase
MSRRECNRLATFRTGAHIIQSWVALSSAEVALAPIRADPQSSLAMETKRMRTADLDLLFIAGLGGSGPDHWQTRWRSRLPTGRLVEQADWDRPLLSDWVGAVVDACQAAQRPVVFVAHSLGVATIAHAAALLPPDRIKGAFLVAAPSDEALIEAGAGEFAPTPDAPLPFASLLVASRNDPYGSYDRAAAKAAQWGSRLVEAGDAGHINADSGHGPWPEGLLQLAGFLKGL